MFQDVEPPSIMWLCNAHVIGHEINDHPHALLLQSRRKGIEILTCSELRV